MDRVPSGLHSVPHFACESLIPQESTGLKATSSTFLNLYFIGWLFSELDAGTSWPIILLHAPCMILQPFASLAEGLAAIWALSSESLDTFEVSQYVISEHLT